MKVLHAFNHHRTTWGSDRARDRTIAVAQQSGIDTVVFSRDSRKLPPGLSGKVRAFVNGIYARDAVRAFEATLKSVRPDIVHTHELFPLISPWILPRCTAAGVPVVHTCYDFRLTCPIASHFVHGKVCRRCAGGHEAWAVLNNCRDNVSESLAFALRNAVARKFRLFQDHVAQFIVPSEYSFDWLMREVGIPPERIVVQPCEISMPSATPERDHGSYVGFAGRLSFEKGVHVLIEAARRNGLPIRLASNGELPRSVAPSDPVTAIITNSHEELAEFYRHARFLVVPSLFEETFSVVSAEAMSHGVPVLASRIGALQSTVVDEVTGVLFEPGNVDDLTRKMRRMWDDPALCRRLGKAGQERVAREFNSATHLRQLRLAYDRAIASGIHQRTVACDCGPAHHPRRMW
jgi:glycosyltransferase involved in cell wall biosynthesis